MKKTNITAVAARPIKVRPGRTGIKGSFS